MRCAITLGLMALGLYWCQAQAAENRTGSAGLAGTYRIVRGERNGKKIEDPHLNDVTVRIGENAITTYDKDKKEAYAATYKLDTTRKPYRILMTATVAPGEARGTKAEGLIEKTGDTVKLIYALPGGQAPTDFHTAEKQQMFVLKPAGK